jgi:hypothetical protein
MPLDAPATNAVFPASRAGLKVSVNFSLQMNHFSAEYNCCAAK